MKFIDMTPASDPSDLIRVDITGLGIVDLYNDAELIEYTWLFSEAKFRVSFQLCKSRMIVNLIFSGITTIETVHDPGPIDSPKNIEFIRFVFGVDFLEQESDTRMLKNVEFATNLVDYRFWANTLEASVHQPSTIPEF